MTPAQRCPRCDRHLPPDAYAPSARGRTGQWCRACKAAQDAKRNTAGNLTGRRRRAATRTPAAFTGLPPRLLADAAAEARAVATLSRCEPLAASWRRLADDLDAAADHAATTRRPRPR